LTPDGLIEEIFNAVRPLQRLRRPLKKYSQRIANKQKLDRKALLILSKEGSPVDRSAFIEASALIEIGVAL
jgi:hypothetical protein